MEAIIFVGIQASGKSTYYKENFYDTHIRLNLDMIKSRKSEMMLFDACLKAKQSFVVDNTNPTKADRERYIESAKGAGFKLICCYFEVDIKEAIERNSTREGKKRVPDIAIRSTHKKLESPTYEEGFDEIYVIKVK